jgi:RNA polymerase sigma-70 factor (ECF subfamily)
VGSGQTSRAAAEIAGETEWIERARNGDTEAFRRLVEGYKDRAFGLAFRIVGSAGDAEEVAQDAFVRAWRALPGFRGECRFGTWLHRIVVRCAYDASARKRRREAREESLDALRERRGGDPASPASVEEPIGSRDEARDRLGRLLERLTDVQRAVVTLYYYEDRSVEEVGGALALPVNTVKTHLHRARATLRAVMRREENAGS